MGGSAVVDQQYKVTCLYGRENSRITANFQYFFKTMNQYHPLLQLHRTPGQEKKLFFFFYQENCGIKVPYVQSAHTHNSPWWNSDWKTPTHCLTNSSNYYRDRDNFLVWCNMMHVQKKDLQAALYHNKYTEKTHLIHNSQEVKGCV